MILDGKNIAKEMRTEIQVRIKKLQNEKGITPGLAVVILGNDPASTIYVRNKENACKEVGMHSEVIRLPKETTQQDIIHVVERLNKDDAIHGILIQLPLPKHLNEEAIIECIDPKKDADGFHPMNVGRMMIGAGGVVSCTPRGCMKLLQEAGASLSGKRAVVVGRSNIVGKPVSMLLLEKNATVTMCHSKTENLKEIVLESDIVIAAVGRPKMITADMVKEGAIVIDVGINRTDDGLVGDVDFDNVKEKASFITPVPGGVGPMTIAMLLLNTMDMAEESC